MAENPNVFAGRHRRPRQFRTLALRHRRPRAPALRGPRRLELRSDLRRCIISERPDRPGHRTRCRRGRRHRHRSLRRRQPQRLHRHQQRRRLEVRQRRRLLAAADRPAAQQFHRRGGHRPRRPQDRLRRHRESLRWLQRHSESHRPVQIRGRRHHLGPHGWRPARLRRSPTTESTASSAPPPTPSSWPATYGLFFSKDGGVSFGANHPDYDDGQAVRGGFISALIADNNATTLRRVTNATGAGTHRHHRRRPRLSKRRPRLHRRRRAHPRTPTEAGSSIASMTTPSACAARSAPAAGATAGFVMGPAHPRHVQRPGRRPRRARQPHRHPLRRSRPAHRRLRRHPRRGRQHQRQSLVANPRPRRRSFRPDRIHAATPPTPPAASSMRPRHARAAGHHRGRKPGHRHAHHRHRPRLRRPAIRSPLTGLPGMNAPNNVAFVVLVDADNFRVGGMHLNAAYAGGGTVAGPPAAWNSAFFVSAGPRAPLAACFASPSAPMAASCISDNLLGPHRRTAAGEASWPCRGCPVRPASPAVPSISPCRMAYPPTSRPLPLRQLRTHLDAPHWRTRARLRPPDGTGQSQYDLTVGVDPQDSTRVYAGLQRLWRSPPIAASTSTPLYRHLVRRPGRRSHPTAAIDSPWPLAQHLHDSTWTTTHGLRPAHSLGRTQRAPPHHDRVFRHRRRILPQRRRRRHLRPVQRGTATPRSCETSISAAATPTIAVTYGGMQDLGNAGRNAAVAELTWELLRRRRWRLHRHRSRQCPIRSLAFRMTTLTWTPNGGPPGSPKTIRSSANAPSSLRCATPIPCQVVTTGHPFQTGDNVAHAAACPAAADSPTAASSSPAPTTSSFTLNGKNGAAAPAFTPGPHHHRRPVCHFRAHCRGGRHRAHRNPNLHRARFQYRRSGPHRRRPRAHHRQQH